MQMKQEIREELNKVLEETTKLSFPFLANDEKKKKSLTEIHQRIDDEIESCLEKADRQRFEGEKAEIWEKADEGARNEFVTLPGKLKMNSFYLQEVMHRYVEATIEFLAEGE